MQLLADRLLRRHESLAIDCHRPVSACGHRPLTGRGLLIEVALASEKIEIVTMAEPFQDGLNVGGELQGL